MNRMIVYWLVAMQWIACSRVAFGQSRSQKITKKQIVLLSPEEDARIRDTDLQFIGRMDAGTDSIQIEHYELFVSAKRMGFAVSKKWVPLDTSLTMSFSLQEIRNLIRRHGRYFWFIEAVEYTGNRIRSETRSFMVPAYVVEENSVAGFQPYSVQLQYNHRLKLPEYTHFLKNVNPKEHLQSYSNIGLCFRQNAVFGSSFQMQEVFSVFSHLGFGAEILPKFQFVENMFFSLHPYLDFKIAWSATDLHSYSSNAYEFSMGSEIVFLPRGYFTIFLEWIPLSKIHYGQKRNGIRTFEGQGWEIGTRLFIPRSILKNFNLFGFEIDFERIPIDFRFNTLRDAYSGIHMYSRKVGLEYLLN